MPPKHFLQFKDFTREEFDYLFARTRWIKDRFKRYEIYQPLRDRTLAMVFRITSYNVCYTKLLRVSTSCG